MRAEVFLSDIDGTLLRGRGGILPQVLRAAEDYQKEGRLALCTGRSILSAREIAEQIRPKAPCILLTGAQIYDFTQEKSLMLCPLPADIFARMERQLKEHPAVGLQVCTEHHIYHLRFNERQRLHGVSAEVADPAEYAPQDIAEPPLKLVLAGDDREAIAAAGRALYEDKDYRFAFASPYFAEVVSARAGKDIAAGQLAALLGVPLAHFFGAGDGMTDLPMLRKVGCAYAPRSAPQAVREACTRVVDPAEEGGMQTAFREALAALRAARQD